MKISIIIPTRNSAQTLGRVLEAIQSSNRKPDEIIVVDDYSQDNTVEIAKRFFVKVLPLNDHFGAGYARNFGARKSVGDILVFIDSDVVPRVNYLDLIVEELSDGADGVGGYYFLDETKKTKLNKFAALHEEIIYKKCRGKQNVRILLGGLCGYKREVWFSDSRSYQENKYFFQMGAGEDCFISEELSERYRLVFHKDLLGTHYTDFSNRFYKRMSQQGYSRMRNMLVRKKASNVDEMAKNDVPLLAAGHLLFATGLLSGSWLIVTLGIVCYLLSQSEKIRDTKIEEIPYLIQFFVLQQLGWGSGVSKALFGPIKNWLFLQSNLFSSARDFMLGGRLTKLFIFVTNRCNVTCSWCLDAKRDSKNQGASLSKELTTAEFIHIAQSSEERISYLTLTGGEPFLRSDIDQIVKAFYKYSQTRFVTITTNGAFPERIFENAERILLQCPYLKLNIQLTVSDLPQQHDEIRGLRGSFELMLESSRHIHQLKKCYPQLIFSIATQMDDSNIDNGFKVLNLTREQLKPDEHFIGLIRDNPKLVTPVTPALAKLPSLIEFNLSLYGKGKSLFQTFYNTVVMQTQNELINIRKGVATYRPCKAGKEFMTLYENGNTFVCENRQDLPMGNIRDFNFNLSSLYNDLSARKANEKQLSEKCHCDWGGGVAHNLMSDRLFLFKCLKRTVQSIFSRSV